MESMFIPDLAVLEKILRAAAVYLFLLLAFRFSDKRQVGQLTPFDLVVLLTISNVVQNAMIGNDYSITGGIIGALSILALNWLVVELTFRYKRARRLLEPSPTLLVHNGRVLHDSLARERVTLEELRAALRRNGLIEPSQARFAVLEEDGKISVVPLTNRPGDAPPAGGV
jgi:uncharacterized membrane protein YcaP (DUF421 family)